MQRVPAGCEQRAQEWQIGQVCVEPDGLAGMSMPKYRRAKPAP